MRKEQLVILGERQEMALDEQGGRTCGIIGGTCGRLEQENYKEVKKVWGSQFRGRNRGLRIECPW